MKIETSTLVLAGAHALRQGLAEKEPTSSTASEQKPDFNEILSAVSTPTLTYADPRPAAAAQRQQPSRNPNAEDSPAELPNSSQTGSTNTEAGVPPMYQLIKRVLEEMVGHEIRLTSDTPNTDLNKAMNIAIVQHPSTHTEKNPIAIYLPFATGHVGQIEPYKPSGEVELNIAA